MQLNRTKPEAPVYIQGPRLRQRWGISNSTFYEKLKAGVIPAPEYPFGPSKPYWRMEAIERFEDASKVGA
ncbi:helix-turn-helix transcriptional regulator [Variovorax boronicumulans]|uniref:helix-turn-helix transcriptional regulator n=1 Tax=Variovorax boronicumulans TaxID=436515 RepID=UPI003394495B